MVIRWACNGLRSMHVNLSTSFVTRLPPPHLLPTPQRVMEGFHSVCSQRKFR